MTEEHTGNGQDNRATDAALENAVAKALVECDAAAATDENGTAAPHPNVFDPHIRQIEKERDDFIAHCDRLIAGYKDLNERATRATKSVQRLQDILDDFYAAPAPQQIQQS